MAILSELDSYQLPIGLEFFRIGKHNIFPLVDKSGKIVGDICYVERNNERLGIEVSRNFPIIPQLDKAISELKWQSLHNLN